MYPKRFVMSKKKLLYGPVLVGTWFLKFQIYHYLAFCLKEAQWPWNRPAYWAIVKDGKESEVSKEVNTLSDGDGDASAGIMFASSGNAVNADRTSISKTIYLDLKANEKVKFECS